LQAGKPIEAELLGKADQRGRLDVGRLRDAGGGAEGDLVRVVQRIGSHLGQAFGEFAPALEDRGAQRVKILRRHDFGCCLGHWVTPALPP
jgi:hypothetical protein